jgi:alkylhydroperoxidase/carboxymuconolactone decarboxylase family protein YurZ
MKPESETILASLFGRSLILAGEIEQDAAAMYGGIPYRFTTLKERPDLFVLSALAAYLALRPVSLDPKTTELIAMTAVAAANAPDCLRLQMLAAQKKGATCPEIRDCLIIASVIRQASVQARSFRILDDLQDEGGPAE